MEIITTKQPQQNIFYINNTTNDNKSYRIRFNSIFDSGNLQEVQRIDDFHFLLGTAPDCCGTEYESYTRSWFYFGVRGVPEGFRLTFRIKKIHILWSLYKTAPDTYKPVFKLGEEGTWQRLKTRSRIIEDPETRNLDVEFSFIFDHSSEEEIFFAFSYPFSYRENQEMLSKLNAIYKKDSEIYFHRELLIRSPQNRAIDLITISSHEGKLEQMESAVNDFLFPLRDYEPRALKFRTNKPVVLITARVHPGESPASHTMNGIFKFLLDKKDIRAQLLRKYFVFMLVPMLNPDGVANGHYRMDVYNQNLNRHYKTPDVRRQPVCYAVKELAAYLHTEERLFFYCDLHSHAAKKGCFFFGNALDFVMQVESMLYAKIMSMNCINFEFDSCNFSRKHMQARDRGEKLTKEGAGRVCVHKLSNIIHSYTLECGFHYSNILNRLTKPSIPVQDYGELECIEDDATNIDSNAYKEYPTYYTIEIYEDIGKAILVSILDIFDKNPCSRIGNTPFLNVENIRKDMAAKTSKFTRFKRDSTITRKCKRINELANQVFFDDFTKKQVFGSRNITTERRIREVRGYGISDETRRSVNQKKSDVSEDSDTSSNGDDDFDSSEERSPQKVVITKKNQPSKSMVQELKNMITMPRGRYTQVIPNLDSPDKLRKLVIENTKKTSLFVPVIDKASPIKLLSRARKILPNDSADKVVKKSPYKIDLFATKGITIDRPLPRFEKRERDREREREKTPTRLPGLKSGISERHGSMNAGIGSRAYIIQNNSHIERLLLTKKTSQLVDQSRFFENFPSLIIPILTCCFEVLQMINLKKIINFVYLCFALRKMRYLLQGEQLIAQINLNRMNKILPKTFEEFEQKEYWDKFFRKLKKNSELEYFEWYGEYPDFSSILKKYVQKSDKILNIGCGKSLMSEKMYDDGFENIVNCDFSEKVIEEMTLRSKEKRPKMRYEVMDVTKMTYEDKNFDVVLDKGTLDALFPKDTPEECQKIQILFKEIERVTAESGIYCCISLLQDHILREIVNYFTQRNCIIDINEFVLKKSKLFPYLICIRKTDKSNGNIITLTLKSEGDSVAKLTKEETIQKIKTIQTYSFFMSDIKHLRQAQRVSVDIWDQKKVSKVPRYTIIVVDSPNNKILEKKSCGCFITPQGRESSYISGTEQGNFELLEQSGMSRLLIAILNPGHHFSDMEEIQKDLGDVVRDLAPKGCSNPQIPFMTDGDEIGERAILFEDDDMFIEEHKDDEGVGYRSLILKANLNQTQSQNKLKFYDVDQRVKLFPLCKEINKKSLLAGAKKDKVVGPDESFLSFEFHRIMVAGLGLLGKRVTESNPLNFLILGGGAGILSKFFFYNFPNSKVETVEISGNIIKLQSCKIYFEWPNDARFTVQKDDAIKFVMEAAAKIPEKKKSNEVNVGKSENESQPQPSEEEKKEESEVSGGIYDVIILDISDPSGKNISPPSPFRDITYLKSLKKILKEGGLMIINVIVSDSSKLEQVLKEFNSVFDIMYLAKAEEELNHVVFALNYDLKRDKNGEQEVIVVDPTKVIGKKELEVSFKGILKVNPVKWDSTMNIESYCSSLALRYPMINSNPLQMSNAVYSNEKEEYTNKTKEMYLEDKEKVTKSKRKKRKQ